VSELAIIAADAGALDQYGDPGAFVVHACERAKQWLTEAIQHGEIDAVVEVKSQAEAIRVYTTQKHLGRDAELAAAEIVRRAERGIGLCVRKGQEEGTIRKASETSQWVPDREVIKNSPLDYFAGIPERQDAYAMTDDVTDEQFDEAIETAKAEKNLSRANVVRKVKGEVADDVSRRADHARELAASGHTTDQIAQRLAYSRPGCMKFLQRHGIEVPADAIVGRSHRINSTRIVSATVEAVDGIGVLFPQIDYSTLDREHLDYWVSSLEAAIRSLTTLKNNLKKELTQ
jgi:DNA-binding NarL/FixJ family response regulator